MSYHLSVTDTVRNAATLVRAGAQAVKLEGGRKRLPVVEAIVDAEIPVMGHLGLTPQSVHAMGGFKVQGRSTEAALALVEDAKALAHAGCFAIVLEGVPDEVARIVTEAVDVPTIGIGAGPHCDGQVLVFHDVLGIEDRIAPKFVRRYASLKDDAVAAIGAFAVGRARRVVPGGRGELPPRRPTWPRPSASTGRYRPALNGAAEAAPSGGGWGRRTCDQAPGRHRPGHRRRRARRRRRSPWCSATTTRATRRRVRHDRRRSSLDRFGERRGHHRAGFGAGPVQLHARGPHRGASSAAGLMEVTDPDLAGHDGMVFVYDEDTTGAFWMRNTPMPLSIAYVDAGGAAGVDHGHGAVPRTRRTARSYPAAGPYRYAVEVPQGRLDDLGITASARLRVGGACS